MLELILITLSRNIQDVETEPCTYTYSLTLKNWRLPCKRQFDLLWDVQLK